MAVNWCRWRESVRGDGTVAAITLVDSRDRAARVVIEKGIGRSTDGKNILHRKIREGRTVRARGLLHRQPDGTVVIRVRNCEEVVYVPPLTEIPNTADPGGWMYLLWLSAAGLIILMPGKPVKARKKSS